MKGPEKTSDIDIRRGTENAPFASVSKGVIHCLIITINEKNVSRL